jgi:hypothetical protein
MKYFCRILICNVLLLSHFNLFCQNDTLLLRDFDKEVIQPYLQNHSLPREHVYVHFNKSCYLPGEDIWFKAYVTDPKTGLLNLYTRNLYVELYNEKGNLIGHKILEVNNGTANNMLKIDDKELPGRYLFRAYTNWMKNFYTAEEFDRPLEVIGKSKEEPAKGDLKYDVQFFPESGTLLAGIVNKVAIKALDPNGRSISLKGIIFDEKNDSITSFNLSKMGMGQVVLTPENNSVYKAKVVLPGGKEETVSLPKVETHGLIASLNVFSGNRIMAEVKSNAETIGEKKLLYILIHAKGNVYKTYTTSLTTEKTSVIFSLDKQSIGNGVNYLTVFDENFQPICERLFYNRKKDIKGEIDITASINRDTTEFKLKVLNDSVKHSFSRLSISVLPGGTVSNRFTSSLLSDILLKSGIRGKIENPQYYLEKEDAEHQVAMDLLMLTQGWRKYEWGKITYDKADSNPANNNFENGFTIEGTVKSWLNGKESKNGSVSILSPANKIFSVANVDSSGHFSFRNLALLDSSHVIVSAIGSNRKGWNRTITASVNPFYKPDSIIRIKPFIALPDAPVEKIEEPIKLMPGVIQLPEFVITAKRKNPFENSIYVSPLDRIVEVTTNKVLLYNHISTILRSEFGVNFHKSPDGICWLDRQRGEPVALFIDDIEETDPCVVEAFSIEQIEAISIKKGGTAILDGAWAVFLKMRTTPLDWGVTGSANLKTMIVKGYSPPAKYYTPKYSQSPETEVYQKYASIYWKPDIVIDSIGVSSLKFNVPKEINSLNVRIEGISDDGTVFLEERTVPIEKGK